MTGKNPSPDHPVAPGGAAWKTSIPPRLKLRVLMLEDNPHDRELIRSTLEQENFDCDIRHTAGRADFEAALAQGGFDLVLSDFTLPQFDGLTALRLVREKEPDLPFILISGTLGEEQAVECLKLGATDCVLKERLARLGPAIRRAIKESQVLARQHRSDEAMRELSRRLLRLQDDERRRVAHELHNSVAQNLVALELNLSSAQQLVPALESKARQLLADSAALAEETATALRTVSHLLHPTVLDSLGLPGALRDFAAGFERRTGIKLTLIVMEDFGRLPTEVETAFFRIVQESLTNIHRHSGSPGATIDLRRDEKTAVLEIRDTGHGMPREALHLPGTPGSIGVGIAGMHERLQLLQGRLEMESSPTGTCVRAVVPIGGTS